MGISINFIKQFVKLNRTEKILQTNPLKKINIHGDLNYCPLSEDIVKLSETAQFEKRLRATCSSKPVKISSNGKETNWNMFRDSQMGSQDAFWAKNEQTGELYYIKFALNTAKEEHIESEILANKLYNLAGVATPEVIPVVINGETKGLASKFIEGLEEPKIASQMKSSFGADAWLANWDTTAIGNTFIRDGKLVKVDNGGALRYRAMGELKPNFGDKVEELISLVEHKDWFSTDVYSSLTNKELIHSFEHVCNISDKAILNIVADKELAQTLINRRNYMRDILTEMKATPKKDEDLASYFRKLSEKVSKKGIFDSEALYDKLSDNLNKIIMEEGALGLPCSKDLAKNLLSEIKSLEKSGVKISREDIIKFLKETSEDGLDIRAKIDRGYINHMCAMEEFYTRMFTNLSAIAQKTPLKEGESVSDFLGRVIKIRERRLKQLEASRIKIIKSKLQYEHDNAARPRALTPEERESAIYLLEKRRKEDVRLNIMSKIPKLDENSPDSKILLAWQRAHLGAFEFSDGNLQEAVMQLGGRYNAKHPKKFRKTFEEIAEKDYKQIFDIEPVYHWTGYGDAEKYVTKELPKIGDIFTLNRRLCCSTHKTFGEMDYGDHIIGQNVKFILHPKSETSRAYNVGFNQEVVYPRGEKFKILDKECVEYINPETGCGYPRWEVHMQEV